MQLFMETTVRCMLIRSNFMIFHLIKILFCFHCENNGIEYVCLFFKTLVFHLVGQRFWQPYSKFGWLPYSVLLACHSQKRSLHNDTYIQMAEVHCGPSSLNRDINFQFCPPIMQSFFKTGLQISIFCHVNQLFSQKNWNMLHFNTCGKWM